jgi:hypothetical protein
MTDAAQINSDRWFCHDPEGGGTDQPKVGEETEHFPSVIWHFSFVIELMTVDRISRWLR